MGDDVDRFGADVRMPMHIASALLCKSFFLLESALCHCFLRAACQSLVTLDSGQRSNFFFGQLDAGICTTSTTYP